MDAQENPITSFYGNSFYEVQKYFSFTRHVYTPYLFCVNLTIFNKLPPEIQQAILESGREAAAHHRKRSRETKENYLEIIKKKGVEIENNPDRESFERNAVKPVFGLFYQKNGHLRSIVSEIQAVK